MAGRALTAALGLLALAAIGQCLNCKVCIPPLSGDKPAQKEAELWRANISRTFNNKAESDFQVCGEPMDPSKEQAEGSCPWDTDDVVCLDIKHGSNWQALSCGRVPTDMDLQCFNTDGGAFVCPCPNSYCNSRGWRRADASAPLAVLLVTLALAAGRRAAP